MGSETYERYEHPAFLDHVDNMEVVPGLTKRDYQCGECHMSFGVWIPLSTDTDQLRSPCCYAPVKRVFTRGSLPRVNYGFRPSAHRTQEEADISRFQFENL